MIVIVDAIVETGFAGCEYRETLEIELKDGLPEKVIEKFVEEEVKEWAFNRISIGFDIKEIKK